MDLVSIIVPVFNVEKYLQDCVDSLKEQTYENIEMIFVDDGSTDGSAEICDRLASSNILVVHKKNGGVSSARNCGLKIAKGKYILFVDADDKIRPDMVFRLVNAIEKSDADIATCRFEKKYKNGKIVTSCNEYDEKIFTNLEALNEMNNEGIISASIWDKLFSRELIEHIEFPLNIIIGEDYTFNVKTFLRARNVIAIPNILYQYNQNEDSVTHRGFTEKSYAVLDNYIDTCNFIRMKTPQLRLGAEAYLMRQEMAVIVSMIRAEAYDYAMIKRIRREVKSGLKYYILNNHVKLYLKCSACMISVWPYLFICMYKLFFKRIRDMSAIE